jgi:hypothetical protein
MTTKYNASLFDSLKEAFNNKTNNESAFKDFLKMESDKTYIVRLVPNVENINNSWYAYSQHIFKSTVTGKTVSTLCPNTYKEKCPICEYRSRIWATKDQTLIDQIKPLKKSEKWLYNVYVISDPSNPANNGQIKYLNAGTQLEKIIENARFGDDAEEFGPKIFDLSENGCNLQIKVETNDGGYPTYVSSRFKSPSKIEGLANASAIDTIYDSFKPVDTVFNKKSYEEIKTLLDVHFLGKDSTPTTSTPDVDDDEDFSVGNVSLAGTDVETSNVSISEQEKRMQDILNDL